ncbi:ROK family protein [Streptomyces sp. SYP-A7185]|uniref:ROK family transcriptional regulator n=1 Tax=Streptomyces sp. SYP-A7185 TaxID=3040076 RepID=UPI0038F68B29
MGGVNRTDAGVGVGAERAAGGGGGAAVGGRTGAGVNLPALRGHNAALVLDLLRAAGQAGISRLELAERTGLTPQAVSKITARLRTEGLAAEAGRRASTGGKPRTLLRLVPDAGHAIGLHLDRDELTAVLADLTGHVVAERRAPLDFAAGADAVVDAAVGVVRGLAPAAMGLRGGAPDTSGVAPDASAVTEPPEPPEPPATPKAPQAPAPAPATPATPTPPASPSGPGLLGVGIALPGPLDHVEGVLHRVTGFPAWDGFPLRDALARRLGLPVVVDKDTNAAALGLALGGVAESFAYLHLGTGLGAGLVLGGSLYRGARTGAGEFGHQVIQLDGPPCGCGDRGCVEALCLAAVGRGDLAEAARVLGVGAGNLVSLLDIDLVLLGGRAVLADEDRFVRGVGEVVTARARRGGEAEIPVAVAQGGDRIVAEGAAQLVLAPLFGRANVAFPAGREQGRGANKPKVG